MARIPDDVVARIKSETSIERLVASSGVGLEKRGKDLVGLCPFHDDTDPSLIVSPAKNLWNCLGQQLPGLDFPALSKSNRRWLQLVWPEPASTIS